MPAYTEGQGVRALATMYEMCKKDVVNLSGGERLGRVGDLEFSLDTAVISSIIVYGKRRFFGLLGREADTVVPWAAIEKVGDDVILVHTEKAKEGQNRERRFLYR